MEAKRVAYRGRLTRTLSQVENWCKKFFESDESKTFLYEHTDERTHTEIYESLALLCELRTWLISWVRE